MIGTDGFVVDSSVGLSTVATLKVGQSVAVTVAGSTKALAGTVSSIGIVDTATDSSTPSYAVTTAITDTKADLLNGASASAVVTIAKTADVLTVPTSALHRDGTKYTVDVLKDGASVATTVTVGAKGTDRTEITKGLSTGSVVILADLTSTTTGDSSNSSTTSGGLSGLGGQSSTSGGPGGQGGPPAGFTGGAPSRG